MYSDKEQLAYEKNITVKITMVENQLFFTLRMQNATVQWEVDSLPSDI